MNTATCKPSLVSMLSLFLILSSLCVVGCSSGLQAHKILNDPQSTLPKYAFIQSVPVIEQAEHFCGPASLAMVVKWAGGNASVQQISEMVYLPKKSGTLHEDLVTASRRLGYLAYIIPPNMQSLLSEVGAGHPVIALNNLSLNIYPLWHFTVVTGYDLKKDQIFLNGGLVGSEDWSLETFEHTWSRSSYWAVAIVPPGTVPVTADVDGYMRAANGLERVGKLAEAEKAYRTAVVSFPGSEIPAVGLANIFMNQKKLKDAQIVLDKVNREHPNSVIVMNNYAELLRRQGRWQKALNFARKASSIDSPFKDIAKRTLEEILAQKKVAGESLAQAGTLAGK